MKNVGKTHKQSEEIAVQTGGFRGQLQTRRRKKLILLGAGVLILLVGLWVYHLLASLNPSVQDRVDFDVSRVSGDYLTMTEDQSEYVLKSRTGLELEKLRHKTLTKGDLKDFITAYEVARAMTGVGERQRAYEAYVIADTMLNTKDFTAAIKFYEDFVRLCLEKDDTGEVKRIVAKAMRLIDKSSLSQGEKRDQKDKFETLQWLSEQ